jgi:hypothetical protein
VTSEEILLGTVDPTNYFDGKPVLALTSLFHRVCGSDGGKFAEATRLVELFIRAALASNQPEV